MRGDKHDSRQEVKDDYQRFLYQPRWLWVALGKTRS